MEQDMTKGSPFRVLIMFTLPLAIGNIFQQLYNMADTIIVGRYVGADALAAVGSTGTVMFLLNGFAQGITAGFAVLTSQRYGAKKDGRGKTERIERYPSFSDRRHWLYGSQPFIYASLAASDEYAGKHFCAGL